MRSFEADPPSPRIPFVRHKYGRELLVDAHLSRREPGYPTRQPHRLDYWEIQLITDGHGRARLGSKSVALGTGRLLFSSPFERRILERSPSMESLLLCFTAGALDAWGDPLMLRRLRCLRADAPTPLLEPDQRIRSWLEDRLGAMSEELSVCDERTGTVVSAMLVEILQRLDRCYCSLLGTAASSSREGRVARLLDLVERRFRQTRRVADYASLLAVSPAHLAYLVRRELGLSPKALIDRRVLSEAKRLLLSTDRTVAVIASELGFEDASYFSRFFDQRVGERPKAFRDRRRPQR